MIDMIRENQPCPTVPRLDLHSRMPLHAQAELLLRQMIQKKEYLDGGLLPDEVSLSSSLGISRNTLRAAISRLVAEGRLERRDGIGTRVVEPRIKSGIGAWHSFTREMAAKGIVVETFSIDARQVAATSEVARALQIEAGTQVLRVDRVRGWEGKPEVHFRSYLHPRVGLTEKSDFRQPLYELIQAKSSIIADQSMEELTAVIAKNDLSQLLAVPVGTALLRRERVVLDPGRRPIEFSVVHYRCDRFRLTLNLRQE